MRTLAELQRLTGRFAPADIGADVAGLPKPERDALARLVEAARIMDALFLRQVWAGNDALLQELAGRAAMPVGPRAPRPAGARAPPAPRAGRGRGPTPSPSTRGPGIVSITTSRSSPACRRSRMPPTSTRP